MAKKKYSELNLSPLKSVQEELARMERDEDDDKVSEINMADLRIGISELSVQISKLSGMNISLQSKIVELMIKISDMVEQVTEMVELLKLTGEQDDSDVQKEDKSQETIINKLEEVVAELRKINEQVNTPP